MARGPLVERIIQVIPTPILVNPERVAIKVACSIAGATALAFVQPASLNSLLPRWAVDVWGVMWLVGGIFGLLGYWLPRRYLERSGHVLIIAGSVEYAISIAAVVGQPGFVSIILVLVVAYCSAIRLLVAAAARRSRRRGRR